MYLKGEFYIKIQSFIHRRKKEKRVILYLSAKEIRLLCNALYISQKSISFKLLDLRFLYLEENVCDLMYYLQRLIGCTANKQLYGIENLDYFSENRENIIDKREIV